jgi:UTP--glucose-1-phosphate uridylyltransferase
VLFGVEVEHEVDERARETRARADQYRETRAGDLRPAFEIDDAQCRTKIPMRLRRKREVSRRANATNLFVIVCALPGRNTRMRNVRDDEQALIASLLEQIELRFQLFDLTGALTIRLLNFGGVLSLAFRSRDLVGSSVLFAFQPFQLRKQPPAARLERRKLLELARHVDAAIGERGPDSFEVVSEKGGIDHVRARGHIVQHRLPCDTISAMAGPIRKAVFPAAGLGTRFLPATKAQPKEMLVLVDKPVIQYGVEEAVQSGVSNIIIVTGRGKNAIEDHFDVAVELESYLEQRGKTSLLEEIRKITQLINVSYVRQGEPLGLGHAVLVTQNLVGDEPFAVILGDDVIDATPPALKQMIDVFARVEGPVLAVERVPADQVSNYGVVKIDESAGNLGRGVYRIADLVEKPRREEAPSNLAIIGRYILTPDIFPSLRATASDRTGEIQLTNGLRNLLRSRPIYAYEIDGVRHDTGNKLGFLKALVYFAMRRPDLAEPFRKYLEEVFSLSTPSR